MYRYLFIAAMAMSGGYMWGISSGLTIADSVMVHAEPLALGK